MMVTQSLYFWALTTTFLAIKMFANSLVQAHGRSSAKTFSRPDDAQFFGKGSKPKEEPLIVGRAQACWRNDLENIPMFLILLLGFVLAGGAPPHVPLYGGLFAFFRTLHTLFYLVPRQPHRFLVFICATVCWLGLAIHLCVHLSGQV